MLIWAGSFVFIKIGLREIKPFNLAFYRFLIASPILFAFILFRRKFQLPEKSDYFKILILALTGVTLLYAVQFVALLYTTATNSSILINTCVIFIAMMSFFMGEKLTGFKIFSSDTVVGDLLMLFDGFLWAVYTVVGKDLLKKYSSDVLTAYAFVFGSVLLFPFAVYEGVINPLNFSPMSWISLLYLGVLCSVVAYVIWYSALKVMGTTDVAVFVYIVPLFTAIMALFVLNEEIGIFTVIGGVMTMLGVYITERY